LLIFGYSICLRDAENAKNRPEVQSFHERNFYCSRSP
jgi:hypothetical protein